MTEALGVVAASGQLAGSCLCLIDLVAKIKGASSTLSKYKKQLQELHDLSISISQNPLLQTTEVAFYTQSLLSVINSSCIESLLRKGPLLRTWGLLTRDRDLIETSKILDQHKTTLCLVIHDIQARALHRIQSDLAVMTHHENSRQCTRISVSSTNKPRSSAAAFALEQDQYNRQALQTQTMASNSETESDSSATSASKNQRSSRNQHHVDNWKTFLDMIPPMGGKHDFNQYRNISGDGATAIINGSIVSKSSPQETMPDDKGVSEAGGSRDNRFSSKERGRGHKGDRENKEKANKTDGNANVEGTARPRKPNADQSPRRDYLSYIDICHNGSGPMMNGPEAQNGVQGYVLYDGITHSGRGAADSHDEAGVPLMVNGPWTSEGIKKLLPGKNFNKGFATEGNRGSSSSTSSGSTIMQEGEAKSEQQAEKSFRGKGKMREE